MAYYIWNNEIYIRIGSLEIPLHQNVVVNVDGPNESRTFTVQEDDKTVAQIQYSLSPDKPNNPDCFPEYVEEEDYDYGLFLSNISNNLDRLKYSLEAEVENENKRKASGFYNVERKLLEARGWKFNLRTGDYHPPG